MTEEQFIEKIKTLFSNPMEKISKESRVMGGSLYIEQSQEMKLVLPTDTMVAAQISEHIFDFIHQGKRDFYVEVTNQETVIYRLHNVFDLINTLPDANEFPNALGFIDRFEKLVETFKCVENNPEHKELGDQILYLIDQLEKDIQGAEFPVRLSFAGIEELDVLTLFVETETKLVIAYWFTVAPVSNTEQ